MWIKDEDYWALVDSLWKLILINDKLQEMNGKWLTLDK